MATEGRIAISTAGEPTSGSERLGYARLLVEIGELDEAEVQVGRELEERPENVAALDLLAKIKHMRGELSAAIAYWAQVHARTSQDQTAAMRLTSLLQLARNSEQGSSQFLVLGPYQLWRKPSAHLELEEIFRLFLARRLAEVRDRCDQLAQKYAGKDAELHKLAILAKAWLAELAGDFDMARSILEALGEERGFETDGDRILALAGIYERLGAPELLERAAQIYRHFEQRGERISIHGHLASLYRRLGHAQEAGRYEQKFLQLFRRRMHRPSFADAVRIAASRYVPLYKLARTRLAAARGPLPNGDRARAIGLALKGDIAGARASLEGGTEPIDRDYLADIAVLEGSLETATDLYVESLRRRPDSARVVEWLLEQYASTERPRIAEYFREGENGRRTLEMLERKRRASPRSPGVWRQSAALYRILGRGEEAARLSERAAALEEVARRDVSTVGRVLAAAVYHFVGKAKGLIHEIWAARKPAERGRGGFLEEILGNLTPEMTQAIRNTFLTAREYAQAKWPHQTRDILDYNYTYKVTKEDEPSGGMSAGLPSALAFLSVFLSRPVPQDLASSGVLIADSHDVAVLRAVGEAEHKVRGAYNRNLRSLILPEENRAELQSSAVVPAAICAEIVRYARNLDEAVVLVFGEDVWIE